MEHLPFGWADVAGGSVLLASFYKGGELVKVVLHADGTVQDLYLSGYAHDRPGNFQATYDEFKKILASGLYIPSNM